MTKRYTIEQEQDIRDTYVANSTPETVAELAAKYDVPVRSIIAKLSHFNVYKAKRYLTKKGEIPKKKSELIMELAPWFADYEIEQFEKLSKPLINKLIGIMSEYEQSKNLVHSQ